MVSLTSAPGTLVNIFLLEINVIIGCRRSLGNIFLLEITVRKMLDIAKIISRKYNDCARFTNWLYSLALCLP